VVVRARTFCLALALSSFATAACDPDEVLGDVAPPAEKPDPAKAAADAAAKQKADTKKAEADRVATCMAGCFEGKAQTPTDRQTCRLTCGADRLAEGHGPSEGAKAALGRFEGCLEADCRKPGSATDAATCRLTCAQAALAGEGAPPLAATARGCAASCLEQTGDCDAGCTGGADDAATCRLQCTSLGERCLGRCEQDPSARPKLIETPPDAKPFAGEAKGSPPPAVPKQTLDTLPAPQ
jgi:hypothetical protein